MSDSLCCPEEKIEDWSAKLRVCGHPLRLKILCLVEKQSSCVSDLWQCLEQPQPVISQHLAVLKEKNIVDSTVVGNKRVYRIVDSQVQKMVRDFLNPSPVC